MAHQVQVENPLPNGVVSVNLPNRLAYYAGAVVALTDQEFAMLDPALFTNGYLLDQGELGVTGTSAGTQTAVQLGLSSNKGTALATGTLTAGSVTYTQPFIGASYKKVLVNLAGATSTGFTITFPTPFLSAPQVTAGSSTEGTSLTLGTTSATTTTLTVGAITTQTGWIVVEGY